MTIAALLTLGSISFKRLSNEEMQFISTYQPAGITLFSRNISLEEPQATKELLQALQNLRSTRDPYIIGVDQEGGRVSRFKHLVPDQGPSLYLEKGKTDKSSLKDLSSYGRKLGTALLEFGVNVNFAPVVDILTDRTNRAIGDRAFSTNSEQVVLRAKAFLQGLQQSGVFGCIKHFPGLGSVLQDTHFVSGVSQIDQETLNEKDLVPFDCLNDLVQMVMVSHCKYVNICALEATRSPFLLTGVLRQQVGFKGLVVSDDMTMNAVHYADIEWKDFIVEAIAAGCDLVLICKGLDKWKIALEAISERAKKSFFFARRIEEAAEKVIQLRKRLPTISG